MAEIKFGTDGWRGLIADDFTFDNVRRVAGAIASYVLKNEDRKRGVIVGYDTRFASQRVARLAAETISGAGISVTLANDYTPTPAISYAVKTLGAAGGVVITSSHNPWNWNGVKFKAKFGGSAPPAIMKLIEDEVRAGTKPNGDPAHIEEVDLKPAYIEAICRFADLDLITKAKFKFAIDSMHGSGRGVLSKIFAERGIEHIAIRQDLNPLFPGINPEPIEPHVAMLQETMVKQGCHAGLATDGDADRIGAVAEDGTFVDSHKIFSILLRWLLERKKWPGEVVRAFNTTRMLDRIAARYGRKLNECSIGFKHIADLMMEREILIGGDDDAHVHHDGMTAADPFDFPLLQHAQQRDLRLGGQVVADLQKEYGPHFYGRLDLHMPEDAKQSAISRARADSTKSLGKYKVLKKEGLDGVKFFLEAPSNGNGAEPWILFRASGTEPLLRLYAEAASPELTQEILAIGEAFVNAG